LFLFAEEIGFLLHSATYCPFDMRNCYSLLNPQLQISPLSVVCECLLYIFTDITNPYLEAVSSTWNFRKRHAVV